MKLKVFSSAFAAASVAVFSAASAGNPFVDVSIEHPNFRATQDGSDALLMAKSDVALTQKSGIKSLGLGIGGGYIEEKGKLVYGARASASYNNFDEVIASPGTLQQAGTQKLKADGTADTNAKGQFGLTSNDYSVSVKSRFAGNIDLIVGGKIGDNAKAYGILGGQYRLTDVTVTENSTTISSAAGAPYATSKAFLQDLTVNGLNGVETSANYTTATPVETSTEKSANSFFVNVGAGFEYKLAEKYALFAEYVYSQNINPKDITVGITPATGLAKDGTTAVATADTAEVKEVGFNNLQTFKLGIRFYL